MTAKEYLQQYLDTDREINIKLDEIRHLRELSTKTEQTLLSEERPSTAVLVAKIVDLEKEVDMEIDRLVSIRCEVEGRIQALTDHRFHDVLYLRYISGKLWREIADEFHYSGRNLTYLHKQALKSIDEIIA